MNNKKFIHHNGEGRAWGIVSVEQHTVHVYLLKYNKPDVKMSLENWRPLFEQAKKAAIEFGAEHLTFL